MRLQSIKNLPENHTRDPENKQQVRSWKSMVGRWNLSFWGNFGLFLGAYSLVFRECFFLNLSTYVTHTISISPLSTAPLGGRHHLHLWPWAWQKQKSSLTWWWFQPTQLTKICANVKMGSSFLTNFWGWKFKKNIWNHYLVEFFFLPFFSPLIQQSILETWKTASGNGFLCLIVIDSWLLCTLFATLKTYMKQWNFDPLEKNIKNEEAEEISFCHSSWCFQSYSSWSVATNSHSTENMFDLPLTQ